jgi:hypothetical protein
VLRYVEVISTCDPARSCFVLRSQTPDAEDQASDDDQAIEISSDEDAHDDEDDEMDVEDEEEDQDDVEELDDYEDDDGQSPLRRWLLRSPAGTQALTPPRDQTLARSRLPALQLVMIRMEASSSGRNDARR